VATNKNPNQRQPGEKQPGTFHYNPGNMSGKTGESHKDKPEQQAKPDRTDSPPKTKKVDN
jgi:hypothetical protein